MKPFQQFLFILLSALLFIRPLQTAAEMTNRLDPSHPVSLAADGHVHYNGCDYRLNDHTLYVDGQLSDTEAAASPYVFNNLKTALATVIAGTPEQPMTVLIAPHVYWLDDPDDPSIRRNKNNTGGIPYAIEIDCPYLHLIGLSPNPEHIVLAVNRGQTQGAIGNFTMLHLRGDGLQAENITFGNYCNVDLDYPLKPELGRKRRGKAIVQAQLVICDGSDRIFIRNCRFVSRLNLCPFVGGRRTFFKDCHFECTDDALAGSAVYQDCHFTFFSSKPFYNTAKTGAVFLNCDIDIHTRGTQYLTKAPGVVTMIDTRLHTLYDMTAEQPLQVRWTRDPAPVICYQSNVTLNRKTCNIEGARPEMSVDLTGTPLLDAYKIVHNGRTLYNIPNLLAGDDNWDPLGQSDEIAAIAQETGRRLTRLPVVMQLSPSHFELEAQNDTRQLGIQFLRWGGFPMPRTESDQLLTGSLRWQGSNVLKFTPESNYLVHCTSCNRFDRPFDATITTAAAFGWKGAAAIRVKPHLVDAPTFQQAPSLKYDRKQKGLVVSYALSPGMEERSHIIWYRLTDPAKMDTIAVYQGTATGEAMTYPLSRADVGYYLMAMVTPRYNNSRPGQTIGVMTDEAVESRKILWSLFDEKEMSTDFMKIPVRHQPKIAPGFWTFDAYKPTDTQTYDWQPNPAHAWYYGTATDGAIGQGLVQQSRGARLFYTPMREKCNNMKVKLIVDPCKTAGQGFGSATGQYMDIYIKFDARTLTGYALRIERTPDYDKAVVFTLVRYDNGAVTPISQAQPAACYRTSCTIEITAEGRTLSATARTTAPLGALPENVNPEVSLSTTIDRIPYTGLGIQHTGSTGASATMIHYLGAQWD